MKNDTPQPDTERTDTILTDGFCPDALCFDEMTGHLDDAKVTVSVKLNRITARRPSKLFIDPRWHPQHLTPGTTVGMFMSVIVGVGDLTDEELELFVNTVTFSSQRFAVAGVPVANVEYGTRNGQRVARLTTEWFTHTLGTLDVAYASVDEKPRRVLLGGTAGFLTYQQLHGEPVTAKLSWCHVAPKGTTPLDAWLEAQRT